MSDKMQMVDIDKIHFEKRFRENLGNLKGLVESIKDKGILQPITIYPDFTLLAGGRRLAAAKEAGLKKIPALIRNSPDNGMVDMREVELIENTMREDFTWEEQVKLIAELDSLCREKNSDWSGRKTAVLLGHSSPMNVQRALKLADAIKVVPELAQCKTQDDALKYMKRAEEHIVVNELRSRQSQTADRGMATMLKIADANYFIGDTFEYMSELRDRGAVHFIEVDPPYGIDLNEQKKQEKPGNIVQTYNEVAREAYPQFLQEVARETYRVANEHCWMIFWFGPTHFHLVKTTLIEAGWAVDDIPAIWYKHIGQTMQPEIYLARTYEPFFICRKGRPILNKRGHSNVLDFMPVVGSDKYHPTQRPLSLMIELLETFMQPSQVCLIPFLGSGVTLRACYDYGVKGMGCDLSAEYKDKFLLAVEGDTKKLNGDDQDAEDM